LESRADLHTHTTYSDGALTPRELVDRARSVNLHTISITDHDTVQGIEEAAAYAGTSGVEIVPGVELSSSHDGTEIHILGYFLDVQNKTLLDSLETFRQERLKRIERIVDKLNKMRIPLTVESVLAKAGNGAVGRPHVASAMVNEGLATSYQQAFNRYIGNGRPAYEKKSSFSPADTIRLIAEAGGLSFLAHPGRALADAVVIHLIQCGLDGIEVVHPSHSPELVTHYRGIVNEYCLLESGGSDFHGGLRGDDEQFGRVSATTATVDVMRRRLFTH
jgi:predicted metal-dependent phosphoesterase TrpH